MFAGWGGEDGSKRPYPADYQLAQLPVPAEDPDVLAAVAADAVYWLDRRQYRLKDAAEIAERGIKILDAAGREPGIQLLRLAGERAVMVARLPRRAASTDECWR